MFFLMQEKNNVYALEYASDILKADHELVLEAVKGDGRGNHCFQYASDTLKVDREFVLEAVKQNGWALEFVSEELQNDPELKKLAEGQSK